MECSFEIWMALWFGSTGFGMALGQLVYGLKYLRGVGENLLEVESSPDKELMNKPLTRLRRTRMLVMFLSFLIIIVF